MTLIRTQANLIWGVPGGSDGKNPPAMQETRVWSLAWEDPLEKGMTVHSNILAWRIRQRSLVGHSPWSHKSNTTEQLTLAFFSYRILSCFTDTELFLLLLVVFSNQLKVSGNPPFYQVSRHHFLNSIYLTSNLCVTLWQFLQYFKLSYCICCDDLWSVAFEVTVVIVLGAPWTLTI